jgi:hypothetical protein
LLKARSANSEECQCTRNGMLVPAYPRILECSLLYMPNCNVIYDVVDKDNKVRYPCENISCFLPGKWPDQGLIT